MASKYPGQSILYEIGSRADIAQSYGVSERTIYRWLNKAAKESGIKLKKSNYPGPKRIAAFKGTRKQLAAKYGVSERTAYRWLNKARQQGAQIQSRTPSSSYPGIGILDEQGTNKTIADRYGVSTRTVQRWKQKAKDDLSKQMPKQEDTYEDIYEDTQEDIFQEPDLEPEIEFEEEEEEEPETDETKLNTEGLINILLDHSELVSDDSLFRTLTPAEQEQYIEFYIQYQYDLDEHQFYNEEKHCIDFSPDFVSTINIWGEEFEDWVTKQYAYAVYDDPFMMP